jgi:hypothetical protein
MNKDYLILKRASASRPSGEWNDDDFDVLCRPFSTNSNVGAGKSHPSAALAQPKRSQDLGGPPTS